MRLIELLLNKQIRVLIMTVFNNVVNSCFSLYKRQIKISIVVNSILFIDNFIFLNDVGIDFEQVFVDD